MRDSGIFFGKIFLGRSEKKEFFERGVGAILLIKSTTYKRLNDFYLSKFTLFKNGVS
jgi:hypothetical protein